MKRWGVRALVVARLGLGTINHTLLTCRYLQREGIPIAGVILNDNEGKKDLAAEQTRKCWAATLMPLCSASSRISNPCQRACRTGSCWPISSRST